MAEGYDGSIRINTQINTKQASSQIMSLENRMVKTANKISALRAKMDALKNTKIPTQEYQEIAAQIEKAEHKFDKLLEKQEQMQREGKDNGAAWQRLNDQMDEVGDEIRYAQGELKHLIDTGKAFTLGSDTEGYARLGQQLQYAEADLAQMNQRYNELAERNNESQRSYRAVGKAAKEAGDKGREAFRKLSDSADGMSGSLKKGIQMLLKYAVSVRVFQALMNKACAAIKEGFSNFGQYDKSFKGAVAGIQGSALTLKNALAAAFAPLVEIALPYIQRVIDYLVTLAGLIGQVTAAITGQKSYTKAIKQATGAIDDQNKAQNKQLSNLDKLNNLTSDSGGGGSSGATMFEEVPIDNSVLDFLQKIQESLKPTIDYANKLKDVFKSGFWDGLGNWGRQWDAIKNAIASIKNSLKDIFTDPAVLAAADKWVQSVAYMLGSLIGSIASIGLTIGANLIGGLAKYLQQNKERIKAYLVSMFDIWAEVNYLLADLFRAIAYVFEAFASEEGQRLTANLIGIFADAFMGATELASKLIRDILMIFIQPFVDNREAFRTALEGFLGVLADVAGTIKQGIDDTFDKMNEVYDAHFKPFFDSIALGLSDTVAKFLEFWNTGVQPILNEWAVKFDSLWKEHIQPTLDNFMEMLGEVADLLKILWENGLKPLMDWVIQNVLPPIVAIGDGIVDVLLKVAERTINTVNSIITIIRGIIQFLTGVFTNDWQMAWNGVVKIFDGIKSVIKGIADGITGIISGIINAVKNAISAITGLNKEASYSGTRASSYSTLGSQSFASRSIEAVAPSPFAVLSSMDIPGYATGQVIPRTMQKHLAWLGDNNKETEVVSPVSTIEKAVENVMKRQADSRDDGDIVIQIDGREVFRATRKYASEYSQRTGNTAYV